MEKVTAMEKIFERKCCIRGYHVYKEVQETAVEEHILHRNVLIIHCRKIHFRKYFVRFIFVALCDYENLKISRFTVFIALAQHDHIKSVIALFEVQHNDPFCFTITTSSLIMCIAVTVSLQPPNQVTPRFYLVDFSPQLRDKIWELGKLGHHSESGSGLGTSLVTQPHQRGIFHLFVSLKEQYSKTQFETLQHSISVASYPGPFPFFKWAWVRG